MRKSLLMKTLVPNLLISLILLTSCDPVVSYDKIIHNRTDQGLVLIKNKPREEFALIGDSVFLNSKDRIRIAEGFDIGGDVRAYSDCPGYPMVGDTLFVGVLNDDVVEKVLAITNASDWEYKVTSKDRAGGGACKCTLEIADEMLTQ